MPPNDMQPAPLTPLSAAELDEIEQVAEEYVAPGWEGLVFPSLETLRRLVAMARRVEGLGTALRTMRKDYDRVFPGCLECECGEGNPEECRSYGFTSSECDDCEYCDVAAVLHDADAALTPATEATDEH